MSNFSPYIRVPPSIFRLPLALLALGLLPFGFAEPGPPYDRPFPLGQVTDSDWDIQMTNAQASSFVFYDHEFIGDTAKLNTLGQSHLVQMAVRMRHVPFPVVIEETPNRQNPQLDAARRQAVLDRFAELGLHNLECRVVIAPAIANGILGAEAEQIYAGSGRTIGNYGGTGRGDFGGGAALMRERESPLENPHRLYHAAVAGRMYGPETVMVRPSGAEWFRAGGAPPDSPAIGHTRRHEDAARSPAGQAR